MNKKRIWISADHGMAVIYFLQSDLIDTLIKAGVEIVLLTDDTLVEKIKSSFSRKGMRVEGLLFENARAYEMFQRERQWWLNFIRRVGGSGKINIAAQSSYIRQVAVEESNRRRLLMPLAWLVIGTMRISKPVRNWIRHLQARYTLIIMRICLISCRPILLSLQLQVGDMIAIYCGLQSDGIFRRRQPSWGGIRHQAMACLVQRLITLRAGRRCKRMNW
jgi:hypothetical protein